MRGPIIRYLRTLGCLEPIAEEIAQETFLRLYEALRKGLETANARAWTFRVARNLWVDSRREFRRYAPPGPHLASRLNQALRDSKPDPEQWLLERERVQLVQAEMMRLTPLQRECMRLRAQGLPYREIAETLGVPMPSAVYAVRGGIERLSRLLDSD